MKSLDERLSEVISPYDSDDTSPEEIIKEQLSLFSKDSLLHSIGTKQAKIQFDLHLEEFLLSLDPGDYQLFVRDCLNQLALKYPISVLQSYILDNALIEDKPDQVLELVKYFVYDKWIDEIIPLILTIDVKIISDQNAIYKFISEQYFDIMNKIINRKDVNFFIRYYFQYCPTDDGINMLVMLITSDPGSVVSIQLVNTK